MALLFVACKGKKETSDDFKYQIDKFADIKILRYKVPGFENLSLKQKKLIYYLSEAALSGWDITWDQNFKHNLVIRKTLEEIYKNYEGDRNSENFQKFLIYLKRVWFSAGIHHHYSNDKFLPDFSQEYFTELINNSPKANFPDCFKTKEELINTLKPILFDASIASKKVYQSTDKDMVLSSAGNFYENVNQHEVDEYYKKLTDTTDKNPISYGLNSKVVKEKGKIVEKVWKLNGMYGTAIEKIIFWLSKAKDVAENDLQKQTIEKLIEYYKTGDLKLFDEYNILWVQDTASIVDFVNGFIEVYDDPLARKAMWESIVNFKNIEATRRTEILSANAKWFEENSPVDNKFKKKDVKGVSAKVITAAILGGDLYPSTAIGINLPNADWIRKEHGSKSVTIENITYSYDQAALRSGFLEEFAYSKKEIERARKYGFISGNLHTDLHECLGHGSGQMLPGIKAEDLKNYHSTIEEARADLFALYYIMDKKMVELGLLPSLEAAKAEYDGFFRNGLFTQLVRIEPGKDVEEAHMRNRQLIAKWCYEKGKDDNVIEFKKKNGKTYVVINDYNKLRTLIGDLLKEIQRIKSEGDYETAKTLVENYGVKVDQNLHKEALERYTKLNLAPYSGFVNPVYTPVYKDGEIIDVKIEYPDDYIKQMLYYSEKYSFLPFYN